MSLTTISRAAADPALQQRIQAAITKEINYDPAKGETAFGQAFKSGMVNLQPIYWSVAVDTESQYASALQAGRGAPGQDADVITDGHITSAVVTACWPPMPEEQH